MTDTLILVVDDNRNVLTALDMLLSREFSGVKCISKPGQIISELQSASYSAVLLDMNYSAGQNTGNEGLFWLRELRKFDPDLSVVMITAFGDIELAVTALKEGAVDFVLKPWDNQKLLATMQTAVQLAKSRRQVKSLQKDKEFLKAELKGRAPRIIGRSAAMISVMALVDKVAVTQANVLITGENGTGKELIAREIHRRSDRSDEIMVTVDLGAVPDSLFESELFGHVKGAFTDARSDRIGKIEAAQKGTLFFDEIGNLSMAMQAKLLSVLENRTITRLGDARVIPVDIRLICATNMDLDAMVEEGSFRIDLLYRINTIQVELPPLRERTDDVLLLAAWFLQLYSKRYNKPGLQMDPMAERALKQWSWPGNVRELQHSMERAVILAGRKLLSEEDFRLNAATASQSASFDGSLEEVESRLIRYTMKKNGGNISAVSSQLGISRQTLYNKMKKYGL
ncbi:MAG: sigma-54-dependent Fis family transcriptional regulator [Bacteroidia bacterium]|nr:MAG: sigma-54-dependent Fis family transcriptional regulator [Bacteroidia bacterium]